MVKYSDDQLDALARRLDQWAGWVRDQDLERFVATVREEIAHAAPDEAREAFALAAPADQLYGGLERYWRKRAEVAASG